jgi:hypothetical protein
MINNQLLVLVPDLKATLKAQWHALVRQPHRDESIHLKTGTWHGCNGGAAAEEQGDSHLTCTLLGPHRIIATLLPDFVFCLLFLPVQRVFCVDELFDHCPGPLNFENKSAVKTDVLWSKYK